MHLFYTNVNNYVITDTVFGSPVLWESEDFHERKSLGAKFPGKIAYRPKFNLVLLFFKR